MSELLLVITSVSLCVMSVIAIANTFSFPKLKSKPQSQSPTPFVSILIPARNEARTIAKTLNHLLSQSYSNYEVIVLDDQSSDNTWHILETIAQKNPRLKIISGTPLPQGWLGKNWACHQLAQHALADILIFTDADVIWQPDALSTLIDTLQTSQADLLTIWPTQITRTIGERLVVPLMAFAIHNYLPAWLVHNTPFPIFSAANGQCMVWRRKSYEEVGGHAAIADNVLDDVTLARIVKGKGAVLYMADGNKLISCRMYRNWTEVRNGFAKNILAGYGNSVLALIISTIFHLWVFVAPWFLVVLSAQWRLWMLCFIAIGISLRALSAIFTNQRLIDALFMPLSVLAMTIIALQAIWWHYRGGTLWKGRSLNQPKHQRQEAFHVG